MTERDPFEILRSFDPVGRERVDATDEARLQAILDGRLTTTLRRRRPLRVVAGVAVASATLATAAWVVLRREPVTEPITVTCHRTALADGDVHVVPAAADPVAACRPVWADGTFATGPIPTLTACVSPTGAAHVFPGGDDVCERVGFASLDPDAVEADPVRELSDRLQPILGATCHGRDDAVAIIQNALDELGLDGWIIVVRRPLEPQRPCAAFTIDAAGRTVVIVSRPQDLVPPAPGES